MSKRIITVSREFGSGGRTIAKEIADKMGYAYYDKDLVAKIAEKSGLAEEYVLENSEYACSKSSFLFSLTIGSGIGTGTLPISDQLYIVQHNIIKELAEKEPCVIVGRCADYILKNRDDCLHTFFHASLENRAHRIVNLYGETPTKPEKRLKDKDNKRRVYYKHYTHRDWGLAQNYDISLDTGIIGIENCVDIVVKLAKEL